MRLVWSRGSDRVGPLRITFVGKPPIGSARDGKAHCCHRVRRVQGRRQGLLHTLGRHGTWAGQVDAPARRAMTRSCGGGSFALSRTMKAGAVLGVLGDNCEKPVSGPRGGPPMLAFDCLPPGRRTFRSLYPWPDLRHMANPVAPKTSGNSVSTTAHLTKPWWSPSSRPRARTENQLCSRRIVTPMVA